MLPLNIEKNEISSSYHCIHCVKLIKEKTWILIPNIEEKLTRILK